MKIGLTGKSNTGKSTFFKAATLVNVEISNRIFTTIEPNKGVGYVSVDCPCKELDVECDPVNSECRGGTRLVPVELIDVAGLVPGAHEGKGLGNQFLSDLMQAEGLIHIIDVAGRTDDQGNPTSGHDPEKDIKFLEEEVDHWIKNLLEEEWINWKREVEMQGKEMHSLIHDKLSGLGVMEEQVKEAFNKDHENLLELAGNIRGESKPIVLAGNKIDLRGAEENYKRLKDSYDILAVCAECELALREADQKGIIDYIPGSSSFKIKKDVEGKRKDALDFVEEKILGVYGSTGVQETINELVLNRLDYMVVYPVESSSKYSDGKGRVLPDAHLIKKGSTAIDLAYKIHSDIGDAFKGAIDAKTGKKLGKDHVLKDGDVIKILT